MSDEENWSQDNYGDDYLDDEYSIEEDISHVSQDLIKRQEVLNDSEFQHQKYSQSLSSDDLDLSDIQEQEQGKIVQMAINQQPVKAKKKITPPYLSKYEKAQILGKRSLQISKNSPLYYDFTEEELCSLNPLEMAEREFRANKIPYLIRRPLPNGEFEEWKLQQFEF